MIKLPLPNITCPDIFSACLSSVPNNDEGVAYVNKLNGAKTNTTSEWQLFDTRAPAVDLHLFRAAMYGNKNQLTIGDVTKNEFVNLYTEYMVKGTEQARGVYDVIRANTTGKCPLCGIAPVYTIDHYLPKARYPAFSIHVNNLVPACDACNRGKGSGVYNSKESQPLHPYYSADHFYNTNWIKANLIKTTPLTFSFELDPPPGWNLTDLARIKAHFEDFDLATKYSTNASLMLTLMKSIINDELVLSQNPSAVSNILLRYSANEKPNSTLKVIMFAMGNDIEVCSGMYL
ncbi:hypothetical protein IBT49_22120 [Erwinia sp. S63]|uniref:HNH endonuclease n=1 Tax=Erwinia sp. S63 TaxID=2769341 RepID=UPI00190910EF|nr:hypothetical protein [Erwinia sp. S63]MBK0098693.1 hypothetical protein [Erwinia sp. S63]